MFEIGAVFAVRYVANDFLQLFQRHETLAERRLLRTADLDARALLDRRFAPSIDDVLDLATPVLKHRMALTFSARAEGETVDSVVGRLKSRIG